MKTDNANVSAAGPRNRSWIRDGYSQACLSLVFRRDLVSISDRGARDSRILEQYQGDDDDGDDDDNDDGTMSPADEPSF